MEPVQNLGYGHNEEDFGQNRSAQMDICKQRNTKVTISFLNTEDFLAQRRATARVAAEDMVPTAVI